MHPDGYTQLPNSLSVAFLVFVSFVFVSLEVSLFPGIIVPLPFSLCIERASYVFPFLMALFYLVVMSWIFCISLFM